MKKLARLLYILPILGAIVGTIMLLMAPKYRIEKAILAIAATVIPFCVAKAVSKLCSPSCGCGCSCCGSSCKCGKDKSVEAK